MRLRFFFGICSKHRNEKKDTQEDAEQRATTDTMVMVKLENIADDLKDIKRESRENREEMKNIERACCHCGTVTQELSQETGRRTAFRPITGGQETGKNQPHRKEAIHENDRTGTSHQNPASEKNVSDKRAKRET